MIDLWLMCTVHYLKINFKSVGFSSWYVRIGLPEAVLITESQTEFNFSCRAKNENSHLEYKLYGIIQRNQASVYKNESISIKSTTFFFQNDPSDKRASLNMLVDHAE